MWQSENVRSTIQIGNLIAIWQDQVERFLKKKSRNDLMPRDALLQLIIIIIRAEN